MTIGKYLLQLTSYACIGALGMMVAAHYRGIRGLYVVLSAVVLVISVYYFTMPHHVGTVTPLVSIIVSTLAIGVVAAIVWHRRARISAPQRIMTVVLSLLAFHVTWLGAGFALQDWH